MNICRSFLVLFIDHRHRTSSYGLNNIAFRRGEWWLTGRTFVRQHYYDNSMYTKWQTRVQIRTETTPTRRGSYLLWLCCTSDDDDDFVSTADGATTIYLDRPGVRLSCTYVLRARVYGSRRTHDTVAATAASATQWPTAWRRATGNRQTARGSFDFFFPFLLSPTPFEERLWRSAAAATAATAGSVALPRPRSARVDII